MKTRGFLILFAALALPAARVEVDTVPATLVQARLEAGAVRQKFRQATIEQLFDDAGCATTQQPVVGKVSNVICTLPGTTEDKIIVGGHFDFIDRGKGIVDDWSGTSLLPSLFQALKKRPVRHTYVFVAFAQEELGLVGSEHFVKKLTKDERKLVKAFVNLECLGLDHPKVWARRATPALLARLNEIAGAIGIDLQGVDPDRVGDDDSHPFLNAKIPVISIHSITQNTLKILHSPADNVAAIKPELHYEAYRLAALYLAYLDQKLE